MPYNNPNQFLHIFSRFFLLIHDRVHHISSHRRPSSFQPSLPASPTSFSVQWKLYDRLMRLETGLNGTRSLIEASPRLWEEKIKENKEYAKFRIFNEKYTLLFQDSIAIEDQTMIPLQFQKKIAIRTKKKKIAIRTKKIWRAKEIVMKSI
ncbi:unnamed protein product [Lactuca saligna]|uniref:Uncharacterized protein n=1 Tax=Lactuca saligna TaxID=75948 RepID=A0AA36E2V8_LACSI|nr:unnamed protein product [Lactuca saligna]